MGSAGQEVSKTMLTIVCFIITCISTIAAIFFFRKSRKMEDNIRQAEADISHFLLYPEQVNKKSLEEGVCFNLLNQVRELEEQLLHEIYQKNQKEIYTNSFIENMAHQMKTSVTALQIRLDLVDFHAKTEEEKEDLKEGQRCVTRLTEEIERVLKSSQLAAGKVLMDYEELDLKGLICSCVERMEMLAGKRKVRFKVHGELSKEYLGDRFWLMQAFENLLKNAAEHTKKGTVVEIRLEEKEGHIKVAVCDEGDGISKEEMPVLFQRFCRGSSRKAGYGIGLSMAQDIIKSYHGSISVKNIPGKGACFLVSLPMIYGTEPYKIVRENERKL